VIAGILRTKIGYRGLICSDDLEMGGVLAAGPIEQATVGHIRAGGDLALICHQEDFVLRGYAALVREAANSREFRRRVTESERRVKAFKKRHIGRWRLQAPTHAVVEKLSRLLWEFGEEVRLAEMERSERPA